MPILERLGLIKSRGLPSQDSEQDINSPVRSLLNDQEALEYAREVSPQDLTEMGLIEPGDRNEAWKILHEEARKQAEN
eukprot:CAMPEP_0114364786 /NCGR_PEP_ID=MMETSP0101-20121206/27801_1 /TAXON_ID=38822 ORGANISM="Pteridomonas danica, Strain PT" /NCGR_SAMPLE_ID=MMETSP0101 /ASSEMBLY_ACC=CAM_ASM_000211 /LENGTH=77 /DNA_ID=CAMNT_0001512549 /DNA_START=15 /DNA_END=245 /DNA_ORIENTATION=+